MTDQLVRAMTRDGFVKITAVSTTEITRRARGDPPDHRSGDGGAGPVLAATSMIGNMQKIDQGSVTLMIQGAAALWGRFLPPPIRRATSGAMWKILRWI